MLHGKEIHYKNFSVGTEADGYSLNISGYEASSSAGLDKLQYHDKMKFSTYDQDNDVDTGNCASNHAGGWWYRGGETINDKCSAANLNRQAGPMWGNIQYTNTVAMMLKHKEE